MDDKKRVTLSLDLGMPEERAFFEAYKGLPKSRAQEFLRRCVMIGFLSRKRQRDGFYDAATDMRLKTNHESDMISKVSTPTIEASSRCDRQPDGRDASGLAGQGEEDCSGFAEGFVFQDDFDGPHITGRASTARPAASKGDIHRVQSGEQAGHDARQPAKERSRNTGWRRPKSDASHLIDGLPGKEDAPHDDGPATRAHALDQPAREAQDGRPGEDAPHQLLEARIFQSLKSENGNKQTEEDGTSEQGSSSGGSTGTSDANLLKGFFGE